MDKLNKVRRIWRALTVFSLVSIVIGTPLLALFALRGLYVPMGIFVAVVGHGFYGLPFYLRATKRARVMQNYLSLLSEGVTDAASITAATRLTEAAQEEYRERMIKKRYYITEQ